jgi:hypothetical protein
MSWPSSMAIPDCFNRHILALLLEAASPSTGWPDLTSTLLTVPSAAVTHSTTTTPSIRESWAARGDCTPGTSCGTHAHDPQKLAGKVTVEDDARVITSEGVRGERSTCQGTRTNGRRRADRH